MESNKQEKYNLMHDNPVASHASWMSKHAQSSRMSPLNQEKEEGYIVYPNRKNLEGKSQVDIDDERVAAVNEAGKAYNAGTGTYNAYTDARNALNKSKDSIVNVNKRIDRVLKGEEFEFKKP